MRKDSSPQLSQIIMILTNINDKLRETNERLSEISLKLNQERVEFPTTIKHIVAVKKCSETPKKDV